jgi:hypothetical protein
MRYDGAEWASRMVQPFGGQEVEEDQADRQLDQSPRQSSFIDMVVDIGTSSGDIHLPRTAISGDIHPAFRPADSTSRPISHGGFQTPREALNPLPEGNQF